MVNVLVFVCNVGSIQSYLLRPPEIDDEDRESVCALKRLTSLWAHKRGLHFFVLNFSRVFGDGLIRRCTYVNGKIEITATYASSDGKKWIYSYGNHWSVREVGY